MDRRDTPGRETKQVTKMAEKMYMNIETGSVDSYDGDDWVEAE